MTDRSKPEIRNLSDAAPGLLCKAGIETAITVDHPEIPRGCCGGAYAGGARGYG